MTQGGSPVREICTPGSVRGAARKGRPYRDHFLFGGPSGFVTSLAAARLEISYKEIGRSGDAAERES
jgi:hypothetical protein